MTTIDFLTAALVVITGIYALLTYRLLKANQEAVAVMREQVNASVRPYVVFDIVPKGSSFEGILTNMGRSAAYDVTVSLEPNVTVELLGERFPPNIITKKLGMLAPGHVIDELFGSFDEIEAQNPNMCFAGQVAYRDVRQQDYHEPFRLDLRYDEKRAFIGKVDIGDEFKKLNDSVRDLIRLMTKD